MFEILFSFKFIWIALLIMLLSTSVAFLCIFLHRHFLYIPTAEWLSEHIYCPLIRVLLLMLMAFLLFPLMLEQITYSQLLELFFKKDFLINMVNILFFSGLIFSFIPVLNHPALGIPILGCIATALFYLHQIAIPANIEFDWVPSGGAFINIIFLMIITHMLGKWMSDSVSSWIDQKFIVIQSKNLVTDVNYLIFQMPVILAYGQSLSLQSVN